MVFAKPSLEYEEAKLIETLLTEYIGSNEFFDHGKCRKCGADTLLLDQPHLDNCEVLVAKRLKLRISEGVPLPNEEKHGMPIE